MKALVLLLIPAVTLAGECVLQSRTATQNRGVITERTDVRHVITPDINGMRRCLVSFRARINNEWHTAHGEYEWTGNRPNQEACTVAYHRAEAEVQRRVTPTALASDSVLVCSDRPEHQPIRVTQIGTVGRLSQFRPHPDRPNEFYHNGTQCRWFLDTEFRQNDVNTFQGVICHVQNQNWVVVDKF